MQRVMPPLTSPRLALALGASLLAWTGYLLVQPRASDFHDLSRGWYTDHFSHLHAARAFFVGGINIWKIPLKQALRPLSRAEKEALPQDLQPVAGQPASESYALPDSAPEKPVVASWSHLPRPYPPGDVVAVLPAVIAYEYLGFSFRDTTLLLIWLFVLYAHIALYFFGQATARLSWFGGLAFAIIYLESVHWALEGFYDVVALIPLGLCALNASRQRWLVAALALAVSLFFHFRALFFAPWAVALFWKSFQSGQWREETRRAPWTVAVAGALVTLSLAALAAVSPSLRHFPLDNPVSWSVGQPAVRLSLVAVLAAYGLVALPSNRLESAMAIWLGYFLVNLQQAFAWHTTLLLPWLLMRNPSSPSMSALDGAKLVTLVGVASIAFRNPLAPLWLSLLP